VGGIVRRIVIRELGKHVDDVHLRFLMAGNVSPVIDPGYDSPNGNHRNFHVPVWLDLIDTPIVEWNKMPFEDRYTLIFLGLSDQG
jgi:hypothetical protein